MQHHAIGAHARDELNISETLNARPVQATLACAASFAVDAVLPLAVTAMVPGPGLIAWACGTSLVFLALQGAIAARAGGAGGAGMVVGAWRVTFWGALAMASTAGVGALFGAAVSRRSHVAAGAVNRRRQPSNAAYALRSAA